MADAIKELAKESPEAMVAIEAIALKTIETAQKDEKEEQAREILRDLYFRIIGQYDYYMDIPLDKLKFITIWVIGTYFHKEFVSYPYLFINATKGAGKTRLDRLTEYLCWNGCLTNNPSEAYIFRNAGKGTLIIDEAEKIGSKDKQALRELLNSGYKKGTKTTRVKKVTKDGNEERVNETFELYTPVMLSNIYGIEEVLADRCIPIVLEKSNNPAKTKLIENFDSNPEVLAIKTDFNQNQCSLCSVVMPKTLYKMWNYYIKSKYITTLNDTHTFTEITTLTTLEEEKIFEKIDKTNINGRSLELFLPLIYIAWKIGEDVFNEILEICKNINEERNVEEMAESKDIAIISFVADQSEGLDYKNISELTRQFKLTYESEDDENLGWLNARWFGRALKRLNLVIDKRRLGRGIEVNLNIIKAKSKLLAYKNVQEKS